MGTKHDTKSTSIFERFCPRFGIDLRLDRRNAGGVWNDPEFNTIRRFRKLFEHVPTLRVAADSIAQRAVYRAGL